MNLIVYVKEENGKIYEFDYTPTQILTFEDFNIGWNSKNSIKFLKIFVPVLLILLVFVIFFKRKVSNLQRKLEEEMN